MLAAGAIAIVSKRLSERLFPTLPVPGLLRRVGDTEKPSKAGFLRSKSPEVARA